MRLIEAEGLDAVDGGYICRSCVRLIERYNSLRGELSNNVMQALPVLRGSNTISSVHRVSVTPGPRPLFSSANPSDSSGSAPVAAGTGSPALTVKFLFIIITKKLFC